MAGEPQIHAGILENGGMAGFGAAILLNPGKDIAIFIGANKQARPAPIAARIRGDLP